MTDCPSSEELDNFLAGTLSAPRLEWLRAHLRGCRRCESELDRRTDNAGMRQWVATANAPPAPAADGPALAAALNALHAGFNVLAAPSTPAPTEDLTPCGEKSAPAGVPTMLGPYRIESELGRGGMGIVFTAFDTALQRRVALKVLRPDRADADARARFVREARAAARLEHDHVVAVYAVGEPAEGPLWLAMQHVAGPSLRQAIAQQGRLVPNEAARIIRESALGLAAAHAAGLIHRDVKPANILLEASSGRARVADFGLVRLLEQPGGTTLEGTIAGTPEYMSPEQIHEPAAVDPRCDVYGLGVTLYESLTGQTPFRGAPHMVLQRVLHEEPTAPRRLNDRVPRDLETICLKCLEKLPSRRYQSARELADDLGRWQRGEPILARPLGPLPRGWRWCRRNPRVAVLGGTVLGLLVLLALGSTLAAWSISREQGRTAEALAASQINLQRAQDAEQQAKNNLARAEQNLALARRPIDECFNVATEHPLFKEPRMDRARKLLLEKTLPFYREFRVQRPDDPRLQNEEAEQWLRVGIIEDILGRKEQALEALERSRDLRLKLVATHPEVAPYCNDLSRTRYDLGRVLWLMGKRNLAQQEYQQARTLQSKLVAENPGVAAYQHTLIGTLNALGALLKDLGKKQEALRCFQQARDLGIQLVGAHPHEPRFRNSLASSHIDLANLLRELGKLDESLKEFNTARDLGSALVKDHPTVDAYQHSLATTHLNRGTVLAALGRRSEARQDFEHARDRYRQLLAREPDLPDCQYDLAITQTNLGIELFFLRKGPESLLEYQQAETLLTKLVRDHPEVPRYLHALGKVHNNLGSLLGNLLNKGPEALDHYAQARKVRAQLTRTYPNVPEYRRDLAQTCLVRGALLSDMNRFADSVADLDEGIARVEALRRLDPSSPQLSALLVFGLRRRAVALTGLGRPGDADADWDRALSLAPAGQRPSLRLLRAYTRSQIGDYARSAAEAEQLGRAGSADATTLYTLAMTQALNAARAAHDPGRPLPQRKKQAEQLAQSAVALLRRTAERGYFRGPASLARLDANSDLSALRDRADYRAFRAALMPKKPQ